MANPDPKALQAAAAAMRDQAQAARQSFLAEQTKQGSAIEVEQENALIQKHAAEQAVKDREALLTHYQKESADIQKGIADDQAKAAAADQRGDHLAAEELRESQARQQASLTAIQGRLGEAQRNLDNARITLDEGTRDLNDVHQRMHALGDSFNAAEKQLDAIEDKARMLGEAGRKLELAGTIDDPVDRANQEFEAEKLLKNANAIQVDTADIVKVTGQDLQLPDVTALPTEAAATGPASPDGDPVAGGPASGDGDATAAGGPASGDGDATAAGGPASGDGDATAAGAPATDGGHLGDEFSVVAASGGADPQPAIDVTPTAGDAAGGVGTASADDLLGVASGGSAGDATFDASQPVDALATSAAGAPAGEPDAGAFGAAPDPTFDTAGDTAGDTVGATPDESVLASDAGTDLSSAPPLDDAPSTADADS